MAAANAIGDKLLMFVIGKAKNPQCFKNVKFLPCCYRNQRKSWMDGKLFEEWLRELVRKFPFEGRNVTFLAHPHIDNLKQSSCISYHLILLPRPNQCIKVSSAN